MAIDYTTVILSGLCAIGGSMAYFRKHSVPSLVGGLSTSILYAVSAYKTNKGAKYGAEFALVASIMLLLAGLARSIATDFQKPVPLLLLVLGVLSGGFYYKRIGQIQRV
ncbi:hypothetical protein I9W82_002399 [Candida metapsilosis]|uniref:Uncharacterized protein n=1 Tax=Candida metapsilosis TaxID=273372 RepID=A0A8H8DBK9_9ASCO|nr:hypothetical protein I9W82_002399 [Candida metapsilosis]